MEKKKQNKQITDEQREMMVQTSKALGIDPGVLESMMGRPVSGSAMYNPDGGFRFNPKRDTGKCETQLRATKRGSKLVKTTGGGKYVLRVSCPEDVADPESYMIDEVNAIMKGRTEKTVNPRGRVLVDTRNFEAKLNTRLKRLELGIYLDLTTPRNIDAALTDYFVKLSTELSAHYQMLREAMVRYRREETL